MRRRHIITMESRGNWQRACAAALLLIAVGSHSATALRVAIRPFVTDSTLQQFDHVPPPPPKIGAVTVFRGRGPLGDTRFEDDDIGTFSVTVSGESQGGLGVPATGYRFHFVDGKLPEGLAELPRGTWATLQLSRGDVLFVEWRDGARWDQDEFSFRMYLIAVDAAGNESAPSNVVTVADDGHQEEAYTRSMLARQQWQRNWDGLLELRGWWAGTDEHGTAVTMMIRNDSFALEVPEGRIVGTLQVNVGEYAPSNNEIDLVVRDATGQETRRLGIYRMTADTLRLCLASPGNDRPGQFKSRADGTTSVLVLKRTLPAEE